MAEQADLASSDIGRSDAVVQPRGRSAGPPPAAPNPYLEGPRKTQQPVARECAGGHEVLLPGRLERGGASRAVKHGELWR
jgi:hypothetical protein